MVSQVETDLDSEKLTLRFVRGKGEARCNEKLGSDEARDREVVVAGSARHSQEADYVALV